MVPVKKGISFVKTHLTEMQQLKNLQLFCRVKFIKNNINIMQTISKINHILTNHQDQIIKPIILVKSRRVILSMRSLNQTLLKKVSRLKKAQTKSSLNSMLLRAVVQDKLLICPIIDLIHSSNFIIINLSRVSNR